MELENIVKQCELLLRDFPGAESIRNYLDERISKESQEKFQFGYFPNSKNINSIISLVGEKELFNSGLIENRVLTDYLPVRTVKHSYFENHNLIFPYKDPYGKVIGIGGRITNAKASPAPPKYLNTSFAKGRVAFGLSEAKASILNKNFVIVVEGQFDCIRMNEVGIHNVVAVGTSAISYYQLAILLRYTDNIVVLFDNDMAGQVGYERAIKKFDKFAKFTKINLPFGYKDIDEYLKENDALSLNLFSNHSIL